MNEGMFNALRAEAQEQNSLLKQILEEQKRTNEMLSQSAYPNIKSGATGGTPNTVGPVAGKGPATTESDFILGKSNDPRYDVGPAVPPEAVGPVTVETVQTLDSGKEDKAKPKQGK